MKRIVISMAAAAMLLLAACQTTPETAAVIGKDGQTLEEKAGPALPKRRRIIKSSSKAVRIRNTEIVI